MDENLGPVSVIVWHEEFHDFAAVDYPHTLEGRFEAEFLFGDDDDHAYAPSRWY